MHQLRTLGTLDLRGTDGHAVHSLLSHPKRSAVLCYLAVAIPHGFQRRDRIAALFWPDHDTEHARHSLRQTLHAIRTSLGDSSLETRGDEEVALSTAHVWCDAAELDRACDEQRWSDAVELYRGDFLDGFFVPDAADFEHWLDQQRERLRHRALQAAWHCSTECRQRGDPGGALAWARRALELAPIDEEPLHRFMRLAAELGDRAAARRAYDRFAERLRRDLELEPSAQTVALVAQLQGAPVAPASAAAAPALVPGEPAAAARPATPAVAAPRPGTRWRRLFGGVGAAAALAVIPLLWLSVDPRTPPEPVAVPIRLAVLPFTNHAAPRDAYLADGLVNAVASVLGMMPQLQVLTGRVSVRDARMLSRRELAERLGATHLVDGQVNVEAGRLEMNLRLTDPRRDQVLLEHRYEGSAADLFTMDDAVAQDVARALHIDVPSQLQARMARPQTSSTGAMEQYHRGSYFFNEWKPELYDSAIFYLEAAVAADSNFAEARALLADAYTEKSEIETPGDAHLRQLASVAAHTAMSINPELPHAHIALGNLYWTPENDWAHEAALAQYIAARELQPSMAAAHDRVAHVFAHICMLDRALEEVRTAQLLDAGYKGARWREVYILTLQQRYTEALATRRRLPKDFATHLLKNMEVEALVYLGEADQARSVAEGLVKSRPVDPWARSSLALAQAAQGDTAGARATMDTTVALLPNFAHTHHPEYVMALTSAMIGRKAEAVDFLERAAEDGFPCYERFRSDPMLAPLRGYDRFDAFMREQRAQWMDFRLKYAAPSSEAS